MGMPEMLRLTEMRRMIEMSGITGLSVMYDIPGMNV